jgi:CheY-like chemotaxis protein
MCDPDPLGRRSALFDVFRLRAVQQVHLGLIDRALAGGQVHLHKVRGQESSGLAKRNLIVGDAIAEDGVWLTRTLRARSQLSSSPLQSVSIVTVCRPHSDRRWPQCCRYRCVSPGDRAAVSRLHPDVLVIDVSMEEVLSVMRRVHEEMPRTRILAFALYEDVSRILEYAQAGAECFVDSNGSLSELVDAIQRISRGELLCLPRVTAELLRRVAQRQAGLSGPEVRVCTDANSRCCLFSELD